MRGKEPVACGNIGDVLALAKEDPKSKRIQQIALASVDGDKLKPGVWYNVNFEERGRSNEKEGTVSDAAGHSAA